MNFWAVIVYWSFGSWKTFGTLLQLYEQSKEHTFIISNNPHWKVDLYFSTEAELLKVIDLLEHYMKQTNKDLLSYFTNSSQYKDIVFVIDEAHLYFDSRHAATKWNNMEKLWLILTQCRKRKVKFYIVTQRLTNIDIRIRRLADYVEEYRCTSVLWLVQRVRKKTYENLGDIGDLEADNVMRFVDWEQVTYKSEALIDSSFFRPLTTVLNIFVFMSVAYRQLMREEYLTYHVVWFDDPQTNLALFEEKELFIEALVKDSKKQYINHNTWMIDIIEQEKNPFLESLEKAKEESIEDIETPAYILKKQSPKPARKRLFIKN